MSRLGSTATARELALFHAWIQHGSAEAAGRAMGCTGQNVHLAVARLRSRYGKRHTIELMRPIILSPLYARIRQLEGENRRLRADLDQYREFIPSHRRLADGGTRVKVQHVRWKRARRRSHTVDRGAA